MLSMLMHENKIEFVLKDGCDGAGSQSVHKSKCMINAASNMFVYGVVALQVKVNSELVWQNPSPNSPDHLRPVYLVREKENDETLINYVIAHTDSSRNKLNKEGLVLTIGEQSYDINS